MIALKTRGIFVGKTSTSTASKISTAAIAISVFFLYMEIYLTRGSVIKKVVPSGPVDSSTMSP